MGRSDCNAPGIGGSWLGPAATLRAGPCSFQPTRDRATMPAFTASGVKVVMDGRTGIPRFCQDSWSSREKINLDSYSQGKAQTEQSAQS
ncbi:hypothetical protein CBOM_08093 [Ceraceosorus bombacis]|uniref:Uncharacterized protein n=1 Tax=Ceraceosorus bombacis TaxID=401625 RepID=A0A0P1BK02_9BASI|nr:hypothetical protein CBOM_08093 [Ceraceosorus bombacis]